MAIAWCVGFASLLNGQRRMDLLRKMYIRNFAGERTLYALSIMLYLPITAANIQKITTHFEASNLKKTEQLN